MAVTPTRYGQHQHRWVLLRWFKAALAKVGIFWRAEFSELQEVPQLSTIQQELREVCGRLKPQILALASCSLHLANKAMALHATVKKMNFHDWLQQALMMGARPAQRIT